MAIYKNDIVDINLETGSIYRTFLKRSIGLGDVKADRFGVRVFRNGTAVNIEGSSCQGFFMRPDGTNLKIQGSTYTSVSGNTAYVILPQDAYAYEGVFTLAIKLIGGGVTGTMRIVDGVVDNTGTAGAVSPTSTVPTSAEIIAAYEAAVAVVDGAVRYDITQSLSSSAKGKARTNIDAAGIAQVVRVDEAQSLTNTQKGNARTNIGAASQADLDAEVTNRGNAVTAEATARANADAELKSAFNDAPVDAKCTNFAELVSSQLNPVVSLKEIDKNYKQFNGTFINASLQFTSNANYTTYVFRLPFYGFHITTGAAKIFIASEMPNGTGTLKVAATVTTSGTSNTTYTLNYDKGAIVVLVWNTQSVDPDNVPFKSSDIIPFTEPRLKLLPIQNEFNFYAKKDTSVLSDSANSALNITKYTGKNLVVTSGNLSDNSSYDTFSFQVPVESITINCTNGYRCCKSYFAPGVYNSNNNLIECVYENDTGRVETFTAKYKEWVSISVNKNSYPNGLNMKTDLAHPFELPGLILSYGQSQSFYKFSQSSYASGSARALYVYYKSGNKVVEWNLFNTRPNTGTVDTWQLWYVKGYDFDGTELTNPVDLAKNGEFELAFKEHGAADYCGGANHGDETTNVFKLFIDGKLITDLSTLDNNYHAFNRIDAFEIATVNRCDTAGTANPEPIITHQKRWVFENGKVTVNETIKTLEDLSVDGMLCCMFPALRSAFQYGIRQGKVEIETMTDSSYEKTHTTENEISYLMYGSNCTARINSKLCPHTPTGQMWINPTADLNKLYYGFWGLTNQGSPVSIPSGTVVWWENEYDVAYN